MSDEDDLTTRRSAAETPEDWAHVWGAADKAHKAWVVVGPIWAVVSNWKAIAGLVAFVLWVNYEGVLRVLAQIAEAWQ